MRVPIEESGYDVRRVKFLPRAVSKPSNVVTTFFVAYFFFRIVESTFLTSGDLQNKDVKEGAGNARKDSGTSAVQSQTSDHWKRAHQELQAEQARRTHGGSPTDSYSVVLHNSDKKQDPLQRGLITAITLPVWTRERKRPLYTAADPEYKEFVKFQSDEEKMTALKKKIVGWTVERLKNPVHMQNLAFIGFKNNVGVDLEFLPELGPPPLYEVPCLIIFRDGLGWGWKMLPEQTGPKLDSLLRLSIGYAAVKAGLKAFFTTSYAIAKAKVSDNSSTTTTMTKSKNELRSPSPILTDKEIERDNIIPPVSQWTSSPQSIQELIRAVHKGQSFRERHDNLIKNVPFSTAITIATETFKRKQIQGMLVDKMKKTRGIVMIRGTVVFLGNRGKYRLEVTACYIPSEDKFLGPLLLTRAMVVKDYSAWEKEAEKKKKKKTTNASDAQAGSMTRISEEAAANTPLPPSDSKEK